MSSEEKKENKGLKGFLKSMVDKLDKKLEEKSQGRKCCGGGSGSGSGSCCK